MAGHFDDGDFDVIGSLDVQSGGWLEVNLSNGLDDFDLHNDINVDGTINSLAGDWRISADVDINGSGIIVGSDGIVGAYTLTITEDATIKNWGRANQYGFVNYGTAIVNTDAETEIELLGDVVYGSGTWYVYSGILKSDAVDQPVFSTPGDPGTWVIDGEDAWWFFAGETDETWEDKLIWMNGKFSNRDDLEDHVFKNCGDFEFGGGGTGEVMRIELKAGDVLEVGGACE